MYAPAIGAPLVQTPIDARVPGLAAALSSRRPASRYRLAWTDATWSMIMWKRLTILWMLVKGDARRLWFALRHPDAPRWLKLGTAGVLLYLFSPIDLIPDFVPVLGVVDDLLIVPAAVRWMLNRLPAHIRAQADARVAAG
jgi:uncharacterized membrane protein YkvA (DUF1232 family)